MEILFWGSALFGTLFFIIKTIFSFTGIVSEECDHADDLDHGSDEAFKVVSLHSLTGFLMMFGWVGLAARVQHGLMPTLSMAMAFTAGVLMMFVTAYLFKLATRLTSPGSTFHIENLIGKRGFVYQKIPADGAGKIQVTVETILREVRAVSDGNEAIASFTEIEIVRIINKTTVAVRPL